MIGKRRPSEYGTVPPNGVGRARTPYWPRITIGYAVLCCVAALVVSFTRPSFLLEMPAFVVLAVTLSVALCFSCAGQWYVHQRFAAHDFVQHNEVGGFIIAVAGTLYAVVLGFLTVVAWQRFTDARQLVAEESAAATDTWHAAIGLPFVNRSRVRDDILRYSKLMVSSEWPEMRRGGFDSQADIIVMDAIAAAGTLRPRDYMESNSQTATMQQLNVLHDIRLRRISANEGAISPFEWVVLLVGAVCIIGFCWLFGLANRSIHLLMTATVTAIITSLLVLLFELQYPFRSDLRILPQSWNGAIEHIHLMQSGSQTEMRM